MIIIEYIANVYFLLVIYLLIILYHCLCHRHGLFVLLNKTVVFDSEIKTCIHLT